MYTRYLLAICLCGLQVAMTDACLAATPPVMTTLRASYESNIQIVVKADVHADCLAAYGKRLDAIADSLKKAGDLDGVIAVREEKKRFDADKSVPAEPDTVPNPVVAKARTDYHQAAAKAEIDKNKKILALTDTYVASLEALKKQLTQQDKIDEATEVKLEMERVRSSAEVTSAQFTVADLSSRLPQPPAVQPKPAAPAVPPAPVAPAPAPAPQATKSLKYSRRIESNGDSTCSWTKTALTIKKGDVVAITAKGSWKCSGLEKTCGPDGYPGPGVGVSTKSKPVVVRNYSGHGTHVETRPDVTLFGTNRRLQNEPYGALLCKVGEGGEVRVVANALTFTSEEEGPLYMDSNVCPGRSAREGCSGSIPVNVEILRKTP